MITKNIGKNTIGDGKKMTVELKKYRRSTHDLSYAWRNTQAPGVLVPFMCEVGLPGDTWDINLQASVLTHPTVGPLFGSFKLQAEIYTCPIRLYNGKLHNNALGIGLDMAKIKLPQIEIPGNIEQDNPKDENDEYCQVNPSSLLSYLGIKGYGIIGEENATMAKNATPILAYWDIFKNYHANKQEQNAYYIGQKSFVMSVKATGSNTWTSNTPQNIEKPATNGMGLVIETTSRIEIEDIEIHVGTVTNSGEYFLEAVTVTENKIMGTMKNIPSSGAMIWSVSKKNIDLVEFDLKNIDEMREDILAETKDIGAFVINNLTKSPYGNLADRAPGGRLLTTLPMFGLGIKTYQSDIFNNWINTEWLDGEGGINDITAIDTSSGSFTMDTLNLAKKVYDMLNRIAVSGGTYQDWIQTVYTNEYIERSETPVYQGGYSDEVVFQEVISNSATENEPLGTLAGRGKLQGNNKGGNITIKIDEPSYIIGLVSLTPRVDYSQGNRWDTDLKTLDDLHKPALDGIGFQDLTTNKMAWWDETLSSKGNQLYTAGKQPAWIDYMTNYNRTFGNFAIKNNEMFMTLNRNYEYKNEGGGTRIKDLTTYIDPQKYNYIFADTSLSAMNFWVQMGVGIKARRKMSAKIIPNL